MSALDALRAALADPPDHDDVLERFVAADEIETSDG